MKRHTYLTLLGAAALLAPSVIAGETAGEAGARNNPRAGNPAQNAPGNPAQNAPENPAGAPKTPGHQPRQGDRPNVLIFLVDDLGWQDTSEPFWKDTTPLNRTYRTPNMERLARESMKFTQAYGASVSSPSRVSLMTGMSAAAHRVTNWTLRKDQMPDPQSETLQWPEWSMNGISATPGIQHTTHVTPLPQLLKDNGYRTILVGKAHFGAIGTPGADPTTLGFDTNIAGHAAGGLASYLGERNFGNTPGAKEQSPFAVPGLEPYWGQDIFVTEALTLEARKQIDTALLKDQPFFLYMSHYAVHVPLDRDPRYYQKYADLGMDPREAAYAALIEGMDKSLGDLRNYLKEKGIDQNTIVIFASDNGGLSVWSRGGRPGTQNFPLRSGKGSAFEGGIRIPLMVAWPGVTDSAVNCQFPIAMQDLMPTVLDMAGVGRYRTVQSIDGENLRPLLQGATYLKRRHRLVWHFPNMWDAPGDGIGPYSAVRWRDWKLIYFYDTQQTHLFNLSEDIFEKIDHGQNPMKEKRRERLARRLTRELKRVDAQLPQVRATGKWSSYPDGSPYREPRKDKKDKPNGIYY